MASGAGLIVQLAVVGQTVLMSLLADLQSCHLHRNYLINFVEPPTTYVEGASTLSWRASCRSCHLLLCLACVACWRLPSELLSRMQTLAIAVDIDNHWVCSVLHLFAIGREGRYCPTGFSAVYGIGASPHGNARLSSSIAVHDARLTRSRAWLLLASRRGPLESPTLSGIQWKEEIN